jgi:hypothetical protein
MQESEIPEDYLPVYIHKSHVRKMANAFKKGAGVNMKYEHVHGGSFQSFFRGVGRTLRRAVKPLKTVARIGLPIAGGVAGEMLGGPLGSIAGGVAGQMAANQLGNGIGHDLKKLGRHVKRGFHRMVRSRAFKSTANALKDVGKQVVHEAITDHAMNALGDNQHANQVVGILANSAHNTVSGMGLGRRPPKGSPEMKAYMAQLRAMRSKKEGSSFVF